MMRPPELRASLLSQWAAGVLIPSVVYLAIQLFRADSALEAGAYAVGVLIAVSALAYLGMRWERERSGLGSTRGRH